MDDYDSEFWTESMMLKQHSALRNIIFNPGKFPQANLNAVSAALESLEFAMLRRHATVAIMQAIPS